MSESGTSYTPRESHVDIGPCAAQYVGHDRKQSCPAPPVQRGGSDETARRHSGRGRYYHDRRRPAGLDAHCAHAAGDIHERCRADPSAHLPECHRPGVDRADVAADLPGCAAVGALDQAEGRRARDAAVAHRSQHRHHQVQGRSVAQRCRDRDHRDSGSTAARPWATRPTCRRPRSSAISISWFIGKPDIVVTMDKPYVLPQDGPDNIVDVLVDPGFTEDMYVMAIESKPADPQSFKVVHHFTTNLVEDPEEDPVGLFLNEYALGKNGDIFPPNSGRLIKAGTKINFNLHLNPRGEETPVTVKLGLKVYPKGRVPKYVAFTQHMGDARTSTSRQDSSRATTATSACRSRRCWRRSSRTCTTAARRSAWKRSIPTSGRTRRGPARRGRDDQLRQQLPVRVAHHVSVRGRRGAAAAGGHDRARHLVARQHSANKLEPEPEELGRLRPAVDRRDELRVGDAHLSRSGRFPAARGRAPRRDEPADSWTRRIQGLGHADVLRRSAAHRGSRRGGR